MNEGGFPAERATFAGHLRLPPVPHLPDCDCSAAGTQGNACRKDPRVGRCVCKPNFQGTHCELCAPGFFGPGCQRECSPTPSPVSLWMLGAGPLLTGVGILPYSLPVFQPWSAGRCL